MKLGVSLPQTTNYDLAADITAAARQAEEIGYDSVWALERLLVPRDQSGPHGVYGIPGLPWPDAYRIVTDPIVALSMAAAVTTRIEVGTCVLVAGLHLPVPLAKTLASLDDASRGRVVAGLGSGWSIDEFAAGATRPIAERGAALDEFLDVAEAVWGPNPVSLDIGRYQITEADVNPKPVRRIPIYLGGGGPKVFRRIARRADGWMPTSMPAADAVAGLAEIRRLAEAEGRDPAEISAIYQAVPQGPFAELTADGRPPFTGSVAQVVEDIADLAKGGIDHVFVAVPFVVRDRNECFDRMAELHAAVRAAGL
jgi:probable F420-dependent oxidoreductase